MTPEEVEERRRVQVNFVFYEFHLRIYEFQAAAAESRAKNFKQGGGGEALRQRSMKLEEAEKKNRELGGEPALKWTV